MTAAAGADPEDDELAAAGLSHAETAGYEQIIARPGSTLAELESWWTRPERLGDTVASLLGKGFVTDDGDPPRYTAVDPAVALAAPLLDYEDRLQRARTRARQLADRYRATPSKARAGSVAEVVSGRPAIRQQLEQIQRSARDEFCCLDKNVGNDSLAVLAADVARPGLRTRTIYEPTSVDHIAEATRPWATAEHVRILPSLPMRLYLADRRYAILPLLTDPAGVEAAVVVHESALLDALAKLFDGLWQRALPLPGPGRDAPAGHPQRNPDVDEQRLLTLLLSGLTDTAIARQLGIAHRTVQRHVASLMHSLGARSRFQIGIQAALSDRRSDPAESVQAPAPRDLTGRP